MTSSDWREVPIGALYRRRAEADRADLPLLSVYRDLGVVLREGREDNFNKPGDDLRSYQVVRPGYLVLNKMKTWQGSLGISRFDGIVSPAYFVAEQVGDTEPRFMHHLLRSSPLIAEYGARSKGIRPNQWDLPWEAFRDIRVRIPEVAQQRAIADHLDAETSRIDAIVSARTQQLTLIGEYLKVETASLLHVTRAPLVALRRIVDLLPGFSYRSEDFVTDPSYARLLRGINVDVGALRWDDAVWIDDSVATTTSRFALVAGDIVMGMDRPIISSGVRIAQVTAADLPAYLVQRVARLRAGPGLSQQYLYAALRGSALADHFAPVFTGVSVPHVSPSQILSYEIPLPLAPQQDEVVRALATMEGQARGHQAAARRQIELLLERRQALITAAVTGHLEIPGVAA